MIDRRDALRQQHNLLKTYLRDCNKYRKELKSRSSSRPPPTPPSCLSQLNLTGPNVEQPSAPSVPSLSSNPNVMILPRGQDPNLSSVSDTNVAAAPPAVSDTNAAAAAPAMAPINVADPNNAQLAANPTNRPSTPMLQRYLSLHCITSFIKTAFVLKSQRNGDMVVRKVPLEGSTGEPGSSRLLYNVEQYCSTVAEDPTIRPFYSDIDLVNVRSRKLRENPPFTDRFSHESYNSKGQPSPLFLHSSIYPNVLNLLTYSFCFMSCR